MDDAPRTAFSRFLRVYKVLFSSLLFMSIVASLYFFVTGQFDEAGKVVRSALVFGVCLWLGFNVHRRQARSRSKS